MNLMNTWVPKLLNLHARSSRVCLLTRVRPFLRALGSQSKGLLVSRSGSDAYRGVF